MQWEKEKEQLSMSQAQAQVLCIPNESKQTGKQHLNSSTRYLGFMYLVCIGIIVFMFHFYLLTK